jgi:hypothetical protein
MSSEYFKNFPSINYIMPDGKSVKIKDIFRKVEIEPAVFDSVIEYNFYEIEDGERPDVVASKLYGDSHLYWTFFLVNQIDSYLDWHKSNSEFNEFIKQKYEGYWLNATLTSDIITSSSKFLLGEKITSSSSEGNVILIDPTFKRIGVTGGSWSANDVVTGATSGKSFTISSVQNREDGVIFYENSDGLRRNSSASGYNPVTYFDHEYEHNEAKRKIKIIKPRLIKTIVSEVARLLS